MKDKNNDEPVGVLAIRLLKVRAKGYPCALSPEMAKAILEILDCIEELTGGMTIEEGFPHLFGGDT